MCFISTKSDKGRRRRGRRGKIAFEFPVMRGLISIGHTQRARQPPAFAIFPRWASMSSFRVGFLRRPGRGACVRACVPACGHRLLKTNRISFLSSFVFLSRLPAAASLNPNFYHTLPRVTRGKGNLIHALVPCWMTAALPPSHRCCFTPAHVITRAWRSSLPCNFHLARYNS
jgi:hypothetical protein